MADFVYAQFENRLHFLRLQHPCTPCLLYHPLMLFQLFGVRLFVLTSVTKASFASFCTLFWFCFLFFFFFFVFISLSFFLPFFAHVWHQYNFACPSLLLFIFLYVCQRMYACVCVCVCAQFQLYSLAPNLPSCVLPFQMPVEIVSLLLLLLLLFFTVSCICL